MIILPAKLSELTGSSKANSTGSSLANSSPGSTQTRQTSNKDTNQPRATQTTWCIDDMLCGIWCGMHMQDMTGNARTWPQLGDPSVPLERWDEIAWKRYKERRNRSYGLEMASDANMTPVCDLQQVVIQMQWDEHATAPKHDNKIRGRDAHKMLNKSLALSYGQIIH